MFVRCVGMISGSRDGFGDPGSDCCGGGSPDGCCCCWDAGSRVTVDPHSKPPPAPSLHQSVVQVPEPSQVVCEHCPFAHVHSCSSICFVVSSSSSSVSSSSTQGAMGEQPAGPHV